MKLQILALALCCSTAAFAATPREVVMKVESIDGKTHWEPERVEAVQGESFKLKFEHNLAAGFPFHGIEIPVLGITKQVNRGQPVEVDVTIPADLKPGEYPIRCQFHAGHIGSMLVVKAAAPATAAAKSTDTKKKKK